MTSFPVAGLKQLIYNRVELKVTTLTKHWHTKLEINIRVKFWRAIPANMNDSESVRVSRRRDSVERIPSA